MTGRMHLMKRLRILPCLSVCRFPTTPASAQTETAGAVQVAGPVYMIEGIGAGNIGVITDAFIFP